MSNTCQSCSRYRFLLFAFFLFDSDSFEADDFVDGADDQRQRLGRSARRPFEGLPTFFTEGENVSVPTVKVWEEFLRRRRTSAGLMKGEGDEEEGEKNSYRLSALSRVQARVKSRSE